MENVVLYHFKPDFMLDNLRSNNYICHLTLFSRRLMDAAGGPERMEYNGSQDYELFLRLTETARKIVHIPTPSITGVPAPAARPATSPPRPTASTRALPPSRLITPAAAWPWTMCPHPGYAGLLQDRLYDRPSRPGEHPHPHLRPHPRLGDLRGVHLRPHHLPGF